MPPRAQGHLRNLSSVESGQELGESSGVHICGAECRALSSLTFWHEITLRKHERTIQIIKINIITRSWGLRDWRRWIKIFFHLRWIWWMIYIEGLCFVEMIQKTLALVQRATVELENKKYSFRDCFENWLFRKFNRCSIKFEINFFLHFTREQC